MADLKPTWVAFAIGAAASKSAAVDLRDAYIVELQSDAELDGTSITFETGAQATNAGHVQLKDRFGSAYTVTISASGHAQVPMSDLIGGCYLKVVSSATEAAATVVWAKVVRA